MKFLTYKHPDKQLPRLNVRVNEYNIIYTYNDILLIKRYNNSSSNNTNQSQGKNVKRPNFFQTLGV